MILSFIKKYGAVPLLLLAGCSSDTENNFDKIMRFEMENAKAIMDESVLQAQQLAQESTEDVYLDDFRNYPIYETYKKTHAELGLDVSRINYEKDSKIQKLEEVKQYEAEQRAKLPAEVEHLHAH